MFRSIKIQADVYDALDGERLKNETFGECIKRILVAYKKLMAITYCDKPGVN